MLGKYKNIKNEQLPRLVTALYKYRGREGGLSQLVQVQRGACNRGGLVIEEACDRWPDIL